MLHSVPLPVTGVLLEPKELFLPSLLALYVDPGSGSMMLQLLLGGVSGIYVIFRMFKQKIQRVFGMRVDGTEVATPLQELPQEEEPVRRRA
jgi:hypothetical protein